MKIPKYFASAVLISTLFLSTQSFGGLLVIRYDYKPGEMTKIFDTEIKTCDQKLADLVKITDKTKNFSNTFEAFENITADLRTNTSSVDFMKFVSTNKDIRKEADECEEKISQYMVGLYTRRDLYDALVSADKNAKKEKLNPIQKRLAEQTIKAFRRNGLFLPDEKLKTVRELMKKLSTLETQFSTNLNEANDFIECSMDELEGLPLSMRDRLEKLPNGKFKVTTKSTDYVPLMQNAIHPETRRRMAVAYETRAAAANTKLLQEALDLRQQIAKELGFKTWSDYKAEENMAKNAKTIREFLESLKKKLTLKNKQDLDDLLKMKKQLAKEHGDKNAQSLKLEPWDLSYLAYQLKKAKYSLDDEEIREYFPSEQVVDAMFEVYSTLLGVNYVRVKDADVWAPHVDLYEVRDKKTKEVLSYFYSDFVPREGKYGHAAAFTLVPGRLVNGQYQKPVSAIVANFNPPTKEKPSLLNHDEVETLFHEFGHIMHQTLTQAPYSSLAGTSVAHDYVEAPSQMMENWVWEPAVVNRLSGHYKDAKKKLPAPLLKKMIASRDFNQGYFYTRQLIFALFDQDIHTSAKVLDADETYKKYYREMVGIEPLKEGHFPATFGHIMGGYDAGYYGYLWSEVFAEDMFTKFAGKNLLSPKVGMAYRQAILASGDSVPADKLIKKFLGREPNNKAFFKRLGIK